MMLIIPILILVSSILFISGFLSFDFLNSSKKIMLHVKKPFSSSPTPTFEPISSPKNNPTTTNMVNKDDGVDLKRVDKDDDDLKRVFDTFDKNGDGFITKDELKESLNNMGIIVLGKDIEEMVENLDFNKDGFVDLGEFKELYELVKEKKDEEGKKVGDDDHDEGLKEAFDVFDNNKDGLITIEELGLVLSSLGLKQGYRKEECMEMIKKVDVDGDGMVNFDEFKMMMRARCNTNSSPNLLHVF